MELMQLAAKFEFRGSSMELLQVAKFQFNPNGSASVVRISAIASNGSSRAGQPPVRTAALCAGRFYGSFERRQCATRRSRLRISSRGVGGRAFAEAEREGTTEVEIVRDEEWEQRLRQETAERDKLRKLGKDQEWARDQGVLNVIQDLSGYSKEEVKKAKQFVSELIKAGGTVEEMIVEAADNGELTPLILLVIKNRLDVARYEDERHIIQALDLLYRRVETEMLHREASLALRFLNELLNFHDGFSREEWLQRSRRTMLRIFPPEDAFTILAPQGFDLSKQQGPIEMPEEEDDILLRIDFIREVTELLKELESEPKYTPAQGFDAESVAIRFRQEEKSRAIEQIRELRNLAVNLKW